MINIEAPNGNVFEIKVTNDGKLYTELQNMTINQKLGFYSFHKMGLKGEGIKIAIIEGGCGSIDNKLIISGGYNFIDNSYNYDSKSGHACAVASIIGSKEFGCAPNCEIYCLRVDTTIDPEVNSQIENALRWCIENKIDVVNISLFLRMENVDILKECNENNIIVCVTSANSNSEEAYSKLMQSEYTVVATNIMNDKVINDSSAVSYQTDFSLYGTNVKSYDISGNIIETFSGSSFSTAYLTSMAILLKQKYKSMTLKQFKNLLIRKSEDLGEVGFDKIYGYGIPSIDYNDTLLSNEEIDEIYKKTEISNVKVVGDYSLIYKGKTKQINLEFYPKYCENRKISYESTDVEIASVDENGLVTANDIGECAIKISFENSNIVKTIDINVEGNYVENRISQINKMLNIPEMRKNNIDGSGVKICIVGSGINNIEDKLIVKGGFSSSFVADAKSWNTDRSGRATSAAAIIAHKDFGIAKGASIFSARIVRSDGLLRPADMVEVVTWCQNNNIDIVVMPSSYPVSSVKGLKEKIESAIATTNMIFVTNAYVLREGTIPYEMDKVICVGKIDINKKPVTEANYDSKYVDCAMFYRGIPMYENKETKELILGDADYGACSYTAGVIALLKQQDPSLNSEKLHKLLEDICEDIEATGIGKDNSTGYGLIKAKLIR